MPTAWQRNQSFFAENPLDFWRMNVADTRALNNIPASRVGRSEEEMLSPGPYIALSAAAAQPFDRLSDWRRSCVRMLKHRISEQARSLKA
jgi:hypothetical protein